MTKAKAVETEQTVNDTVILPRSALIQFVDLVEGLEKADRHYKPCQSSAFRSYAQGAYKAMNVQNALRQAKDALENA